MPEITCENIGIAFDMHGCPNQFRHCCLGYGSNRSMSEKEVRNAVSAFREYFSDSSSKVKEITVASWFREPDSSDDYRRLYDLEAELSDGQPARFD